MTSSKKQNDTKLLLAVAGGVTAAAAVIVFFTALSEDRDARVADVAQQPLTSVVRTISPAPEPAFQAAEMKNLETTVEFASYETATETDGAPVVPVEPPVAEPQFDIDPDDNFVARGLEAWHAREFEKAAAYFGAEVAERPDGAWTQYMLGLSARKAGRLEEALQALQRSAELDPASIKTPINLARVHNDRGEYELALDAVGAALAIDAQDAGALFLNARSLSNLDRADEALASLEQSIAADDGNGYAHNLLGLIHLQDARIQEALAAFERAAELEPAIAYIRNNLGMALERNGSPVAALEEYRAAAELDPGHQKAQVNLARLEVLVPETAEPVAELAEALAVAEVVAPEEEASTGGTLPAPESGQGLE